MTNCQKLTLFSCYNKSRKRSGLTFFGLLLLLIVGTAVQAQNTVITGNVKNKDGEPLSGASITVKGTSAGTSTDDKGNFSITIPSSVQRPALVVSVLNYVPLEINAGNQQNIEIILQKDDKSMDEVIVTGYTNVKKGNITGSIGVVSGKQLTDIATPNASSMLQGKVAGVDVLSGSGRPGSTPSIAVRGRSTLNSTSTPLWVVDGTIMSDEPVLNPNDIESISVLKDASSAALYGSRAANGVIVVTTKSAKGSDRKSIDVTGRAGVTMFNTGKFQLMNSAELVDYYKSFANPGSIPTKFNDTLRNRDVNWLDLGSQNAMSQEYNISYTGSTPKAKIFAGVNYFEEEGTVKGYDYNRISGRMNIEYKLNDKLTFKPKLNAAFNKTYNREHSIYDMYRNMPWDLPYNAAGKPINAKGISDWWGRDQFNYLYDLQWNFTNGQGLTINTNADFQYDFNKHWSFKSTNNITYVTSESLTYADPASTTGQAESGRITNINNRRTTRFTNQMLTYKNSWGDHSLDAIAAYEYNDYKLVSNTSAGKGIVSGATVLSAAATPVTAAGNITEYTFRSYLFNAAYAYSDRYSLSVSLRSDGSSRFARKYGTFYAVGGAWNISNEKFFSAPAINLLRLRANYGGTGNVPTSFYGYYDLINLSTQYNSIPGAFPNNTMGNRELTWEKTYTTDAGLEIGLFNRLNISVDAYNRNTSELVYSVTIPTVSGYLTQFRNIGAVSNKGIEATISYSIIKNPKAQWNIDLLIGTNRNKVKELYNHNTQINGNQLYKEGEDINSWYMPVWAGVNPENGNPLWETVDASGTKGTTGTYSSAPLQIAGTATPDYFGGINTNASYKGFSLRINTAFRKGGLIYHADRETFDSDGAYPTYNNMVLKSGWSRWTPENRTATHPRPFYGGNNNSNKVSSRYLEDGSFFRIRNISLGYALPASVNKMLRTKNISATISVDNLYTATKFSGLDPESISYPQPKRILFGLSVGF